MNDQKLLPPTPRVGEVLYEVDKKCPLCKKVWKGMAFLPNPNDQPRPRYCDDCIAAQEADFRKRTNFRAESEAAPEPDLQRPKRAHG